MTHDPTLCPRYHTAVEIIGKRWNGAILQLMLGGASRFTEFSHAIPAMSDKMLSDRLKELEAEGIIRRNVIPDTPVRVEYHLTDKGQALRSVIDSIGRWAHDWIEDVQSSPA